MKMLFKKMPYLKFVVVLVGYLLFTGQTSTENCSAYSKVKTDEYSFDPAKVTIPAVNLSGSLLTGTPYYHTNSVISPLRKSVSGSCDDEDLYFYPSSIYVQIKNGSVILDSLRMNANLNPFTSSSFFTAFFRFNLPGTYTLRYIVNIQGIRLLGPETSVTVTGAIINPGKYKLSSFSYKSSGNDTTYNYSGIIDTNKNYLTFTNGFRMNSMLQLPFSSADRNQYKWLTLDSLKMDYTNGTYAIERTNTIGNYDLKINYQGNQAVFNGELTTDSLVLRWKYGGNQNAPTFTLKYKK